MAEIDSFIGTGWSFPPRFDLREASVAMSSGELDIHQSLEILFTTSLGERIMNPKYGCSLKESLYEPMNTGLIAYIKNLLETAILYHEARIDAEKIEVQADASAGVLHISVAYRIRGTNSRFNFVYPLYLQEANG